MNKDNLEIPKRGENQVAEKAGRQPRTDLDRVSGDVGSYRSPEEDSSSRENLPKPETSAPSTPHKPR